MLRLEEVTNEDISSFVDTMVRVMNNPVFGKLPCRQTAQLRCNRQPNSNMKVSFVS